MSTKKRTGKYWVVVRITEHFSRTAPGSLLILQQGAPGCIDIDGNTLLRDIYLSETFMDGVFPEQFEPVNATWMHWLDVIENKDGRLAGDGQKDAPEKNLGTSGMKMQEMDSTRERITAKSKKAMRAEHRRSEKSRRQSAAEGQQPLKQTAKEDDREITEEQIAACDALFDKLLQGISTT